MPRDRLFAVLFLAVSAVALAAMPGWRSVDSPPAYAMPLADFVAWQRNVATAGLVPGGGVEADGVPLVRPPPGDVPVLARRFGFTPALELRAGQSYRLHLAAEDVVHSAALAGREVLLVPGTVQVVTVTPRHGDTLVLQCGEYCGIGHSRMRAAIRVVD